jgi:hypothetical protein
MVHPYPTNDGVEKLLGQERSAPERPFATVAKGSSPGIDRIGHQRLIIRRCQSFGGDSHQRFHHQRCRNAIVIAIPPSGEDCSRSRWNRVNVPVESAFMMRWKP